MVIEIMYDQFEISPDLEIIEKNGKNVHFFPIFLHFLLDISVQKFFKEKWKR